MNNNSLIKNIIYKSILNLFNIILPILTIPYVYRLFNSEIMGQIEFTQSITNYFLIFAGFGVYTYGLREISKIRKDKKNRQKLFTELFLISIISSICVLLLYLGYLFLKFNSNIVLKNLLLINAISIFSCIFYIEWINEAFENYSFITKKTIFIRIISTFLIFILLKKETDFYKYLLIINAGVFFNNIFSFIYVKKNITLNFQNINLKKYIIPLVIIILINNINILYTNLDKIVLGFYSGPTEVAYYAIGQKVMSVIFTLIMTVITVSIPRLSYYLFNDKEKYIILLNKIIKYMSFLIFPIAFGIVGLREEIVLFFGGNEYIAAASIVAIFGIRMIILAFESILSNQVIFLYGKERAMAFILGSCGIINLLLKLILIFEYSNFRLTGLSAIVTTMLAEILIIIMDYIYIRKYLKLNLNLFSKNTIYYLMLSIIFIPIIELIKEMHYNYIVTSIISAIVCSFIYAFILFLLKENCILEVQTIILEKIKKN